MTRIQPPRFAEWLLRLTLDASAHEAIAGDLEEDLHCNAADGTLRARLRYWRLAVHSIVVCVLLRPRAPSPRQGDSMVSTVLNDLSYALRLFRRQPGFATVLVLTLSLGIGGTTAMFALVEAVLLRPLPYTDEDRIVMVWETAPAEGIDKKVGTPANFQDWRSNTHTIDHLSGIAQLDATLTGQGDPQRLDGRRVSASVFAALGVQPLLGRAFTADDERVSADTVIVAHHLWRQVLGAKPGHHRHTHRSQRRAAHDRRRDAARIQAAARAR